MRLSFTAVFLLFLSILLITTIIGRGRVRPAALTSHGAADAPAVS